MKKTIMLDIPSFHCLYFGLSNYADQLEEMAETYKERTGLYEVVITDETAYQHTTEQAAALKEISRRIYEETNKQIEKAQEIGKGRPYHVGFTDEEIKQVTHALDVYIENQYQKELSRIDKEKQVARELIERLEELL